MDYFNALISPFISKEKQSDKTPVVDPVSSKLFPSPLNFTTARFRMLANAEGHNAKYQCFIEDNLLDDQYSLWDTIIQYQRIAYKGIDKKKLLLFILTRSAFRQSYYRKTYSILNGLEMDSTIDHSRPCIKYTDVSNTCKSRVSIDQVVRWFPTFIKCSNCDDNSEEIHRENQLFRNYLLDNIDRLLEEYYTIVDQYPHELLKETIKYLLEAAEVVLLNSLVPYEKINETCEECGTGFESKSELTLHLENKCTESETHRCQCLKTFDSHVAWTNHWLKSDMSCPVIAWHIWRNTAWESSQETLFRCDGCLHYHTGFLEFWNHINYCPFFRVYLLANCQWCDDSKKSCLFHESCFQELMKTPHHDKVGIKVLQEWAKLTTINFRVKILSPDEINLLQNIHLVNEDV